MVIGLKQILDYDDYAAIPADGKRYELLEGEVYVTPAPSPRHQWVSKKLQRQLEDYFEERGIGRVFNAPIDVILTIHDIVQPDLVVVTDPTQISARGIEGAPTLLAEVLSPSTTVYDRTTKSRRYGAFRIPHLWFVDPNGRRLECFRFDGTNWQAILDGEGDQVLAHPDWPGLTVRLGDLWM
jgi:Uma2 family endonuclease